MSDEAAPLLTDPEAQETTVQPESYLTRIKRKLSSPAEFSPLEQFLLILVLILFSLFVLFGGLYAGEKEHSRQGGSDEGDKVTVTTTVTSRIPAPTGEYED
jgi:hypothetical protein